jgi:RNA polymerase sigma-32 factor
MAPAATVPVLTAEAGLTHYFEQIRRFPMLERREEYMLAKRWREHRDRDAAHKLVTSHLRLVAKIARDYRGYELPISEVISEGNIGLVQAVERFEPEKGFRLATYAVWWIKAAIQEYILRSWSLVKLGTTANQKKLFFNLRKAKSKISALDEGDMRPDQVKLIAKVARRHRNGCDRHEPSPRRRCRAQRHDPRGRRFRRVAGLAGGRIPGPGDDARREREVR